MRGLGLDFTKPVGTWGKCDMCLCLVAVVWAVLCVALARVWEGGVMFVCVVNLDSLF